MSKKPVLRTCAVSKEKLDKTELFRIVRSPNGIVFIDSTLKANGRGCYLKKDEQAILKAKRTKILDKNLDTSVNEEIYEELLKLI